MKYLLKLFNRMARRDAEDMRLPKLPLKDRYLLFQTLLRENNRVLLIMADMGEKLSGEYLFDRHYVHTSVQALSGAVLGIIDNLDKLAAGKYKRLYGQHHFITDAIEKTVSIRRDIPISELTLPIASLVGSQSDIAGGKIAHLGEIRRHLRLPVPEGFSITAYASKRFLEHNKLTDKINSMLQGLDISNVQEISEMSRRIRDMVTSAEIPDDLMTAIQASVDNFRLGDQGREPGRVSVRSSAILEDGEFSFAGQYATFLNVPLEMVPRRYKEVVASLFTPRAIFYYKTKGLSEEDIVMAVGVMRMIDAGVGGVIYTMDPNDPDKNIMIINAARGLGKSVVDGLVEPDLYCISKTTGSLVDKKISFQPVMLVCNEEGDIMQRPVPDEVRGMPCLSDEQIRTLYAYASALEKHYGQPQDIEWAVDRDSRLFILQSRRLKIANVERGRLEVPRRIEGHAILLDRGIIACRGIGHGAAFVVRDEADLNGFPEGGVLVARHTSTKFVTVMAKASAIITDIGGVTGHMASLAREYRVPAILDTEVATTAIRNGQVITVDAFNGTVYEGKVEKLLEYASQKKDIYKDTPLYKTLDRVLKWVVPLNLIDPEGANFRPEHCSTYHDITRFAHEKAMAEMFLIGKSPDAKGGAIPLGREGPLEAHFVDMDGGVREGTKVATPEDIVSIPFAAFLKGLLSIPWPEPRATDVTGFLGMMATIATTPESELYRAGQQSFALIASNYMNFSIRLGYHFSMVEAYAGENRNDNYIKYFFKGGGAAVDRRLRRVRLITELLKMLDFKVTITEDVILAGLTKFKQADIEKKCMVLGKLTVYTKQLDLIMYNDALIDHRIEEFVREHITA